MTVTSVVFQMFDYSGMSQVYKTLSASEIASQWDGSNRLDPGETRRVSYVLVYPDNVPLRYSTTDVTVTITDDAGNTTTVEGNYIHMGGAEWC